MSIATVVAEAGNEARMPRAAATGIEPREFRAALGHFATGVTVITACTPAGERVGVTANSFNSVSLDPPMVLWSLARASRGLAYFVDAGHFCVNVLAADQVGLSNHFARPGADKFAGIRCESGLGGAPLLAGCAARFQCRTAFIHEGGDHLIFVGEVVAFDESGKAGLVFHQGKYAVSDLHAFHAPAPRDEDGGFVDDYLDYLLSTASHRLQRRFQRILDDAGRHRFEWRVMAVLSDRPRSPFAAIARRTLIETSRLRSLLREMEQDDLVSSQAWDHEEEFYLTDRGQGIVLKLLAAAKAHEVDALGHCSADEVRALKVVLKKLIASLEAES